MFLKISICRQAFNLVLTNIMLSRSQQLGKRIFFSWCIGSQVHEKYKSYKTTNYWLNKNKLLKGDIKLFQLEAS
jgi:hypothetical protein